MQKGIKHKIHKNFFCTQSIFLTPIELLYSLVYWNEWFKMKWEKTKPHRFHGISLMSHISSEKLKKQIDKIVHSVHIHFVIIRIIEFCTLYVNVEWSWMGDNNVLHWNVHMLKATLRSTIVWIVVDAMCLSVSVCFLSRRFFYRLSNELNSLRWWEVWGGGDGNNTNENETKTGEKQIGKFSIHNTQRACVCFVSSHFFCWVKQRPHRILINLMPVFFTCLYRVYTIFRMYNKFILPWHGMRSYASNGSFCIQFIHF